MATNFSNNNISAIKIQDKLYNIRTIPFHGTETEWNSLDYIPKNGEIIIVNLEDGGVRFKIGDGVKTYAQLPFEDEAIRNLIDTKSAVTLETWNNADNADSSITIGNLTINKIKSKEIYDAMRAAGKIDENELYLVEGEGFLPIEITPNLTAGIEIGTIEVNGNTYTLYAPDNFTPPVATEDVLGGIKSGGDITINNNGIVSVNKASTENDGLMSSEDKAKLDAVPIPENIVTTTTIFDSIIMKDQINGMNYIVCMRNGNLVSYSKAVDITLAAPPTKMTYMEGEYLDTTGMVINVVCEDGSMREVNNYTCDNYVTIDNPIFIIAYVENNVEYTLTIDVTVTEFDETILQDFTYEKQSDGTYLITGWKGTVNGVESPEEMVVPDNPLIVI